MKRIIPRAALVLASAMAGACSSGDSNNALPNLSGTWNASTITITNSANSAQVVDAYAAGERFNLVINSNMTYQSVFSIPNTAPDTSIGTFTQTATTIIVTENGTGTTNSYTYTLNGNTMTLRGGTLTFNFGGGQVPATAGFTLVR